MPQLSIEQLLEAGVHFGHQKSRWHPKMRPFIFGVRNGIHIIDLRKTMEQLNRACDYLRTEASRGKLILFVGTKRQIKDIVAEEAARAGIFWISERWFGGALTNFRTMRQSVATLRQIEKMFDDGTVSQLTKKETSILQSRRESLHKTLAGIRDMERHPDIMFVIDGITEKTAIAEARRLGIKLVGLIDTNCDPDYVDLPIPGNDDAIKSVRTITAALADAIIEGRKNVQIAVELPVEVPLESKGEVIEKEGETN